MVKPSLTGSPLKNEIRLNDGLLIPVEFGLAINLIQSVQVATQC